MQAPVCANCVRRGEVCEYAGVIDASIATPWRESVQDVSLCERWNTPRYVLPQNLRWSAPMRNLNCSDGDSTANVPINTLLKSILDRSWFTPVEAEIWSSAILKNVTRYSYLKHCIFSIAYLRRDLLDHPSPRGTSAVAYEHQMAASALFRKGATVSHP